MAKPAFIYAFDNLGPNKFTELCNLLLASRFKGYCAGGEGPDGGIDGEANLKFGIWLPEQESPLINTLIPHNKKVIFQFKHKITARVGQNQSRKQLLNLFEKEQNSELDKPLLNNDDIYAYVLVTNVEVNSKFRDKFVSICKQKKKEIQQFQIIGLDDLEAWVTIETQLRYMYFPTIFGLPRYDLKVDIVKSNAYPNGTIDNRIKLFTVQVLNIGIVSSYISHISLKTINNGKSEYLQFVQVSGRGGIDSLNPRYGDILEPGRKHSFNFELSILTDAIKEGNIPIEIDVCDEIGNHYIKEIEYDFRKNL